MSDVTFRLTRVGPSHLVGGVHCVVTADLPGIDRAADPEASWAAAEQEMRAVLVQVLWGEQEALLRRLLFVLRTWPHWSLPSYRQEHLERLAEEVEVALGHLERKKTDG